MLTDEYLIEPLIPSHYLNFQLFPLVFLTLWMARPGTEPRNSQSQLMFTNINGKILFNIKQSMKAQRGI